MSWSSLRAERSNLDCFDAKSASRNDVKAPGRCERSAAIGRERGVVLDGDIDNKTNHA